MARTSHKSLFLMVGLAVLALLLDQVSKILLSGVLTSPISLIEGFFTLRIEHNFGMAFSITLPYPVQLGVNLLFFGGIIVYLARQLDFNKAASQIIVGLLMAGAFGNLIDRIRLGYVIDFISIGSFPVFNLADSFITVSIFLLVLFYDKIKRPN